MKSSYKNALNDFTLKWLLIVSPLMIVMSILISACGSVLSSTPTYLPPLPTIAPLGVAGERQLTEYQYLYQSIAWSPDGKYIAANRNKDPFVITLYDDDWEIIIINVETQETEVIDLGDESINRDPTWSPSGGQLAFMSSRSIEGDDTTETRINNLTIYNLVDDIWRQIECQTCGYPQWMPDGNIMMTGLVPLGEGNQRRDVLIKVNPISGEVVSSTIIESIIEGRYAVSQDESVVLGRNFYSPDGKTILMEADFECSAIWKYALSSSVPEPFIDSPDVNECDPAYSWDGSKLAYTVSTPLLIYPTHLNIADVDGSSPETILEIQSPYYTIHDLAWSPDGSKLALVYGFVSFEVDLLFESMIVIIDIPIHLQPGSK